MSRQERLRIAAVVAGSALVLGLIALIPAGFARAGVETPKYEVQTTQPGFEVRRYSPRLVAEVTVEGNANDASNAGFRILADFIFGNNESESEIAMTAPVDRTPGTKIAMTAPVDRTPADKPDTWVIAFTMPSKYTLETLPTPRDSRVQVRQMPARTYAVKRFRGAPNEARVQEKIDEFVEEVDAAGLTRTSAEPTYARYDPPWTPGLLRRNEIFIELRD